MHILFLPLGKQGKQEYSRQSLQGWKASFIGKIKSQKTENKQAVETIFTHDWEPAK